MSGRNDDGARQSLLIIVLRWVFFVPLSIAGGFLAYTVVKLLHKFDMPSFEGWAHTWATIFTETAAAVVQGVAVMHIAQRVAPAARVTAASIVLFPMLVLASVMVLRWIPQERYLESWSIVTTVLSGCFMLHHVHSQEQRRHVVALGVAGSGLAILVLALGELGYDYATTQKAEAVPPLEQGYWVGYYDKPAARVWCAGRFYKVAPNDVRMVLLGDDGESRIMRVTRRANGPMLRVAMVGEEEPSTIEADQLLIGKRYFMGRLSSGRMADFWKQNEDDGIYGWVISSKKGLEFTLKRIENADMMAFLADNGIAQHVQSLDELDGLLAKQLESK